MRILLFLAIFFSQSDFFAQENYPTVVSITTTDKLMNGLIGETSIRMYLSFHAYSNQNGHVYSLSGWYAKGETPNDRIEICGLSHGENLTLYRFDDDNRTKELLNFETEKGTYFEEVEYYENLKGFKEKFTFNDQSKVWESYDRSESLELYSENYHILEEKEYLMLDEKHSFCLQNLGPWVWGFHLISHHEGRYLLGFDYGSNLNYNGRCGAGEETGYVEITLDANHRLLNHEIATLESCLMNIEFDSRKELEDGKMEYHCTSWSTDEKYVYEVDRQKATLIKK